MIWKVAQFSRAGVLMGISERFYYDFFMMYVIYVLFERKLFSIGFNELIIYD